MAYTDNCVSLSNPITTLSPREIDKYVEKASNIIVRRTRLYKQGAGFKRKEILNGRSVSDLLSYSF